MEEGEDSDADEGEEQKKDTSVVLTMCLALF